LGALQVCQEYCSSTADDLLNIGIGLLVKFKFENDSSKHFIITFVRFITDKKLLLLCPKKLEISIKIDHWSVKILMSGQKIYKYTKFSVGRMMLKSI
jgi:hypothetical protein